MSKKNLQKNLNNDQKKSQDFNSNQTNSELEKNLEFESEGVKSQEINQEMLIKTETLQAEMNDWKERAMRYSAEIQNIQKQTELDVATAKKSAKKYVAQSLNGFLNTLNLAFNFAPKTDDENIHKFIQTLKGSFNQLQNDLNGVGIELIVPKESDLFDPEFMVALNEKNENEENPTVKNIAGIGLKVDNQVIQPASVML